MDLAGDLTYGLIFISLYFEVFLLVSYLERRFMRRIGISFEQEEGRYPSVAIVVPCRNEEHSLASTLRSVVALVYPKDKLEILVVDDGSTDGTLALARTFEHDPRVRVFTKGPGGKHTAMNLALARTKAELIGCLDADSVVDAEALRRIVPIFEDRRVAGVTPGIHVKEPRTLVQHMQKVEYRLSLFNRFILASIGSVFITPGPFSVFRASIVRDLGGWNYGHSTEDMELALRIQQAGHLIGNAPGAIVHTAAPRGLPGLFRQRVRWTYGWLRNAIDYRSMIGNRAFGDLGLIILPAALISIFTAVYFFVRALWEFLSAVAREVAYVQLTGALPYPSFDLFYLNTSALWILIVMAIALVLVLIAEGSKIGTSSRTLPLGTPLFLFLYCFLAPLWLSAALVRATFKTGVRWK